MINSHRQWIVVVSLVATLGYGTVQAQGPAASADQPRAQRDAGKLVIATDTSRPVALSQAMAREAERQVRAEAAATSQQPAPQKRSWFARHKVLTIVILAVTPFVVWGALVASACGNGGC